MDRIQVEQVGKRYRLGGRRDIRETVADAASRWRRVPRPATRDVWSLRGVSFTVAEGAAVGVVGRNGAGKSTLLKVLMRITSPTEGVSRTRGRVAALLEVGTGFHPELTGRENVFLSAAVLGMSRGDTVRRFDDIVDFAGTERFLDTPVKRYSSGMYLRLAFSIAAHLEPDVLIVDEVLAVGDAEFQRKCLGRMSSAEREGRTVVFVSHDLQSLSRLCPRALWLDGGRLVADGPTPQVLRSYLTAGLTPVSSDRALAGDGPVRLLRVDVRRATGDGEQALVREDDLLVEVRFEVLEECRGLDVAVFIVGSGGVRVLDEVLSDSAPGVDFASGVHVAVLHVPPVLNVGDYTVGVWLGTAYDLVLEEPTATTFSLHGSARNRPDRMVVLDLPWEVHQG